MEFTSAAMFLFSLISGADCTKAESANAVTVAVLEVKARGVDARLADALLDIVAEEAARVPSQKVLTRKEMEAILTEEARKQLVGCDDTSCLAELAGALNASFLISGEVARIGGKTLLTLQLINHRYATVVNRVALEWPGSADAMPDVARAAAQLLVLEKSQRAPGVLEVINAPPAAVMFLDGKPLAGARAEGVEVGVHEVLVSSAGMVDRTVPVVIKSGATSRVDGALALVPIYRRPVFWGAGVVGVGAVATLVALTVVGIPAAALVLLTGGATASGAALAPETGYRP